MHLPIKEGLPIQHLASCFNSTSATYKYYWFLSIIQALESGETTMRKTDLFARMFANAWYTVNYFHISFGKQDKLQRAIETVLENEQLQIDDSREKIVSVLTTTQNAVTTRQLKYFNNQVPHWFLSPWFPGYGQAEIYRSSQAFKQDSLYALYAKEISVNPKWLPYLVEHAGILKDFCYWNLALFLQAKNPNIPDIPNKLIKPALRNNLVRQRKNFWDIVFKEEGQMSCIYTSKPLTIGNYAVEHFVPYSFVSHDLMWNLIPADALFNKAKSDKLPPLDRYFDAFYNQQKEALTTVSRVSPNNKFLEDYLTIFPTLSGPDSIAEHFTKDKFMERLQPLITIAANDGFQFI